MNLLPQPGSRARFICDALIAVTTILIVSIVVSAYQETFRHLNAMESAVSTGPASRDAVRLTVLEHRIAKLEAQGREDGRIIQESLEILTNSLPRVLSNSLWVASFLRSDLEEVRREIAALRPPSKLPAAPPAVKPVVRPSLKAGIPAAVYDRIAANAARQWPDDFDMQKWEIDRQLEAFASLQSR